MLERTCTWKEDEDGIWESECRNMHQFYDGGPYENFQVFCGYCGARVVAVEYREDNDEPESDC
jgi:hypothetical protein